MRLGRAASFHKVGFNVQVSEKSCLSDLNLYRIQIIMKSQVILPKCNFDAFIASQSTAKMHFQNTQIDNNILAFIPNREGVMVCRVFLI